MASTVSRYAIGIVKRLTMARPRFLAPIALVGVASALISSLWIAIGSAAPEFIWQGLRIAATHTGWIELLSALLTGVILAFFVEPAMQRVHDLLHGQRQHASPHGEPRSILFAASLSLAFAVASVCLHDALTAFVSGRGEPVTESEALVAGIELVISWSIVPFAITLAWLSLRGGLWLVVPMGIVAIASPGIAGWLFSWPPHDVMTTAVPCLLILACGYRQILRKPVRQGFVRCARAVALVGTAWLLFAVVVDAVLTLFHASQFDLYTAENFWIDARFYLGWTLGLILAPFPFFDAASVSAPKPEHDRLQRTRRQS